MSTELIDAIQELGGNCDSNDKEIGLLLDCLTIAVSHLEENWAARQEIAQRALHTVEAGISDPDDDEFIEVLRRIAGVGEGD